ncbi:PLP-dependent aminotransferase family protein [Jeotgalibacillus sp. R-1-5s-1]|uniref:aminotransferase-like domain-containing protein n=1 Tax=Jeotgalibacillus sp. R-1-5s-1 TaxID=2555897 RepID=UPI00106D4601|nr:PLP-dependent aminotransferase family protein [Jeotgalibacillus sp. R-1-5s-1]TFD94381.1 PLP-dependent aminotransferase family protein [Jeotgalibacillus sp. R-1-5s-1]
MGWTPDRASGTPLSKQIQGWITDQIRQGVWPSGTRLPTQRKLAEQLKVNRSTIVQVLDELKAEGFLTSKVGSGVYVSSSGWENFLRNTSPDWRTRISQSDYQSNIQTIQLINEHEKNPDLIRLGTGELSPELIPSDQIQHSLGEINLGSRDLGYSEPKGSLRLRQVLVRHLKKFNIKSLEENILIVSGGLQALQLVSIGLIGSQANIYVGGPSYLHSLPSIPTENIHWHSENSAPDAKNHSFFYTIPTLNNPTGTVLSVDERQRILDRCKSLRLPIIEDGVYQELTFEEAPQSLKSLDLNGQVLHIGSMSKVFSPGLRVGWITGPQVVIDHLADLKMQLDYGSSAISQEIAAQWLESNQYHQHLVQLRRSLKERAAYTEEILTQHFMDIATWNSPQGGFYIWLKVNKPVVTKTLFQRMIKRNVLINPGYIYDPGDYHHLRISYAYSRYDEIEKGLLVLGEEIRKLM